MFQLEIAHHLITQPSGGARGHVQINPEVVGSNPTPATAADGGPKGRQKRQERGLPREASRFRSALWSPSRYHGGTKSSTNPRSTSPGRTAGGVRGVRPARQAPPPGSFIAMPRR
jgi:hypothetical protein